MPLAPIDLFACIKAAHATRFCGLHGLRVNDGGTGRAFAACGLADASAHPLIDLLKQADLLKAAEVAVDGLPSREVVRQVAPLAAGVQQIKNGVEDFAHFDFSLAATFGRRW